MLPVRSIAARSSRLRLTRPAPLCQRYYASAAAPQPAAPFRPLTGNPEIDDPGMNDGYSLTQPPPIKRQFRDPYQKWWDPQERRNFGEPVHEDEDQLGIFTPYEYTVATPKQAGIAFGCFIAAALTLCGVIYQFYPDKPAIPREFPDNGLETALGGKGATLARPEGSY
ncbi:hypothetical protein H072_2825 [Dactylellina haptotyla CBS 200.50]|uniref:NADH:ubiquinone oxidoreductase 20.1kD subunit n=1 Tax=Dactylellina haptotyla (strain CBS 200.50) TaxID=1284197 RepID=S8AJR8_DACHA|nr:hypothetical protein H072_2825 [Dactylellina haptotyla CBS 200.50]